MFEDFNQWFNENFCEVSFLCANGDPNWLGYLVLGLFGTVLGKALTDIFFGSE